MITIAFAFLLEALWLILSPFKFTEIIAITSIISLFFIGCIIYCATKKQYSYTAFFSFSLIGILWSTFLYIPVLQAYQTVSLHLPIIVKATFTIERNHYPSSTTIKILTASTITDNDDLDNVTQKAVDHALRNSSVQIFNISQTIKQDFIEGEVYQAKMTLRARYFRNIPGDRQRILQALARKEIGYGKFNTTPIKLSSESTIRHTRQKITHNLVQRYPFGHYLSALSVGITKHLATEDWDNLRKTGTIHLVSISGLHLSLTAFYAFVIFRILAGLIGFKKVPPYKIAALSSIIVAWSYAILAGLSLPTTRAAIMFSLTMIALLINRPIFSLQGVSVALLVILTLNPLSVLQPGFWLSFIAVIILVLSAKIFTSPLKVILLTQLTISMLLIPLTASFFGEISIISPLINLFAIPWTSMIIMPALLIGTLLLLIYPPFATFFISIADQGVYVLTKSIYWSSQITYASILTSKLPLISAIILTFSALLILYIFPKRSILSENLVIKNLKNAIPFHRQNNILHSRNLCLFILFATLFAVISVQVVKKSSKDSIVNLYLLPVGEGLSLLLHSQESNFLFDTGNRFMRFDAGKQTILPTLRHLNIYKLNQIFLSLQNQQHIGGTRSIRTRYPQAPIVTHPDLKWLIEPSTPCADYQYQSQNISITPISSIQYSCAFQVILFNHIRLHLISDITEMEWQTYLTELKGNKNSQPITQEIWLYPNQGRRTFPNHNYFSHTKSSQTILFSTRETPQNLQQSLKESPHIQYYNSYYGTIHIQINMKNAKFPSELRIENYADKQRYWWLQP